MVSFSTLDYIVVLSFLILLITIGLWASKYTKFTDESFLLSNRKVGLSLFILTNVATWYGGILGVGEFAYNYGLVSWFTQGLPYYIFAILFALFFAEKIRTASLYTIPDKLEEIYDKKVAILSSILIFILVSPAPYLLILAQILTLFFDINYFTALIIAAFVSSVYLLKGGYKSNIFADAFAFFIMFIGFFVIVFVAYSQYGGLNFLESSLPQKHLSLTGDVSYIFIIVWFLIALWTFTDPGFHQRCYSAKSGKIAKRGILISVIFWFLFDFLTNSTGLYSRAIIKNLENPVLSFPLLADKILSSGLKGLFFAAMIATVLSTLNSFVFLSATTFSNDFVKRLGLKRDSEKSLIFFTQIGIIITLIISILIALFFTSVVYLWYTIGSICIPGLILLVISAYYPKFKVPNSIALFEIILAVLVSLSWYFLRKGNLLNQFFSEIEPMIIGLMVTMALHIISLVFLNRNKTWNQSKI